MKFTFLTIQLIGLMFLQLSLCAPPQPTEKYANNKVLIEPDVYYLYWNYNKTDVVFEIQVKTTGWVGFGLSPNGGMEGSDVIVTWVDKSGKVNFTDRHIKKSQVVVDKVQNWNPISVSNQNGYLVAKFSRKIKICDPTNEDRDIEPGTPYFIFSYGKNFMNGDITYHDGRGSTTLPLISSVNSKADLDNEQLEITDFRIDSIMDGEYSTIYYCQVFKLPEKWVDVKQHLLQYETLYAPETKDKYHHWTIAFCSDEFEKVYLKNNSFPKGGYCVKNDNWNSDWDTITSYCGRTSLAWAIGSSDVQNFPEDIAFPLGGDSTAPKYFMFQIHFNNPQKIPNLRDRSGVRFYTTTNYRKTEFDIFSMGTDEHWDGLIIPPNAKRFEATYGCTADCVERFFEETDEIKIFAAFPHTHLTGREVYLTVIRDGQEAEYIVENRYYDFEHQYLNFLNKPVILKKGDSLKATCVYNTEQKKNFTYAGYSTQDEMKPHLFDQNKKGFLFYIYLSLVNFMYYPRGKLGSCGQVFDKDTLKPFFEKLAKDGDTKPINSTSDFLDITILNPNSNAVVNKFQDFYNQAERFQGCIYGKDYTISKVKPPTVKPMQKGQCVPSA